ncbi:zinc finger, CCHC-type containing protein [Tanacetum coccineum]
MAAAAMKYMASNFAKLDKFEGVNVRRCQKKMHFLFSSMSVVYVLTTLIPKDGESATDSLEAKYIAEDASSKKFLVSNFTNYKMTDSRPVVEQYNELLGILGRFTQHKINMDKAIQVSYIIDKLPPSWKDFKHTVKHKKEELTLVELGSHLRIEESLGAFCYVYLLHTKDEVLDKFKVFKTEVELQQGPLIKRFRTDRGGEYMDTLYFQSVGIIHETTAPYTPKQNGIFERKNRVLKEMVNSMLSYSGLRTRDEVFDQHSYCFNAEDDPKTFDEAMKSEVVALLQTSWLQMDLQKKTKVARISTIRVMIYMASIHNLIIHQMDVKTTFLNGELDEEVDLIMEFLSSKFSMKDIRDSYPWVLKYLKKTIDYSLVYTGYPSILEGYTNARWISNTEDNLSTSGRIFLLAAGEEAEWLRNQILKIPLWSKPIAPISIRYDSATTLAKAYSQMYNGKSRHLGVRHSMIRELIMNVVVSIEFVRS